MYMYACVCTDSAVPAHARTRAHRPAAPRQSSGVSQTPHPTVTEIVAYAICVCGGSRGESEIDKRDERRFAAAAARAPAATRVFARGVASILRNAVERACRWPGGRPGAGTPENRNTDMEES